MSLEAELLRIMAPIFTRWGVSATYRHYLGTAPNEDTGKIEDTFEEFDITAIEGQRLKFSTLATGDVQAQVMKQAFVFRDQDLPDGVTADDLTRNDQVEFSGQVFSVSEKRWRAPFIRVAVEGG